MSVYDSIRDGIQDDWRKAREYDEMKRKLELEIAQLKSNPEKDAWKAGYDTGYELCRQIFRGEKPLDATEHWEKFKSLRQQQPK